MKKLLLAVTALMISIAAKAQIESHVRWSYAFKRINTTEAVLLIKATIDKNWHIYSQHVKPGGPLKTAFAFTPSKGYTLVGKTTEPAPTTKYEKVFKMNVGYFENSVVFQQRVKLKAGAPVITGKLEFLACADHCLPPEEVPFSIPVGK